MKILFVVSNISTNGGAEKSVVTLINALHKNYDIHLATFYTNKQEHHVQVPRISLDYTHSDNILKKLWCLFFIFPLFLRKTIKKNKYDLVISNAEDANISAIICKLYTKFTLWTCIRNNIFHKNNPYYWTRYLHNLADTVVVQTKAMQNKIKRPSIVIPNALPMQEINKKMRAQIQEKELFKKKTILTIGRLAPQKNHRWLIDTFRTMNTNAQLVIIGSGPEEKQLKKYIKNDTNILFLGHKDNVYAYLARCTVFVLPSLYEGMPRALMEALACGCTCVVNDCETGPRELLGIKEEDAVITQTMRTKYGVLVPYNNTLALREALQLAVQWKKNKKKDLRYDEKYITRIWRRYLETR